MKKLAVVYFLKTNLDKINYFRKQYDPNWFIIPPHITIVFPLSEVSDNQLVEHLKKVTKDVKPFSICLNGLSKTDDGCLFLLVKEGKEKIVSLHNKLYSGILTSHMPAGFPFIPHITLGDFGTTNANLDLCVRAYTEAQALDLEIKEAFNTISLITGDGKTQVKVIQTFSFK